MKNFKGVVFDVPLDEKELILEIGKNLGHGISLEEAHDLPPFFDSDFNDRKSRYNKNQRHQ